MSVRLWIMIAICLALLVCVKVFAHEDGCVKDGRRVRHFDTSKPKWGIGPRAGIVHGHEMVHPTNPDLNYLQWFLVIGEGADCYVPAPPPEPEVKPKPEVKPNPNAPIVEPVPEPVQAPN